MLYLGRMIRVCPSARYNPLISSLFHPSLPPILRKQRLSQGLNSHPQLPHTRAPESRTVRGVFPWMAHIPRSRVRTAQWCGRWRTCHTWRCSSVPYAAKRPGSVAGAVCVCVERGGGMDNRTISYHIYYIN